MTQAEATRTARRLERKIAKARISATETDVQEEVARKNLIACMAHNGVTDIYSLPISTPEFRAWVWAYGRRCRMHERIAEAQRHLDELGVAPAPRRCCDCRNGEHENLDNDVLLCVIREDARIVRRGYICAEHREAYMFDGYDVVVKY